jgi:hypothetical protein
MANLWRDVSHKGLVYWQNLLQMPAGASISEEEISKLSICVMLFSGGNCVVGLKNSDS